MINTIDVVTVKYPDNGPDPTKKGKAQFHGQFCRPYLSFGRQDDLVKEEKVIDSVDGKVTYWIGYPKNGKTVCDPSDLLMQALDYLGEKQDQEIAEIPDGKKKEEKEKNKLDPTLILLRYAEAALANEARMAKYQELKPTVIDVDKANLKFAEGLVQQGKATNISEAYEMMKKFGLM